MAPNGAAGLIINWASTLCLVLDMVCLWDRHREAETAAARLAFETVPARLAHLLLDTSDPRSGAMSFPLNQTEIANLIGSSRETVCSILNQFRRGGWLEIERGRIRVIDRRGLGSVN